MANESEKLTGSRDTMVVAEAYRLNITHVVCRDHWHGRKPMPSDAPALGRVEDARNHGGCEFCAATRRERGVQS